LELQRSYIQECLKQAEELSPLLSAFNTQNAALTETVKLYLKKENIDTNPLEVLKELETTFSAVSWSGRGIAQQAKSLYDDSLGKPSFDNTTLHVVAAAIAPMANQCATW